MKKIFIMLVVLCMFSAPSMAGMTVFSDMDELSENEMSQTTGKAGISIQTTPLVFSGGYIGWGDDDGLTTTVAATNQGWLTLSSVWGDADITPVTVDVGSDGINSWLTIGAVTVTGNVGVKAVKIGDNPDAGNDTGEFRATGLRVETSPIKICGH